MERKTVHTENTKEQFSATNTIQKQEKTQSGVSLQDNRPKSVLQRKQAENSLSSSVHNTIQKKANSTGLPDHLKSGIENLSGHSMDDVKVHYNSNKPQQVNAHAYAQGTDIHLASGQEKHLPHEAWHVVQQKQGRIKPTMQMKSKANSTENMSSEPIQRMKVVPEPGAMAMLGKDTKTIETFHTLIDIMQHALSPVFPKDSIEIEITNKGEMTPAWNHHKGDSGNIVVQLNRWYLEKVSIGNLIGMFIHEIGVHTFADKKMKKQILPNGSTKALPGTDGGNELDDEKYEHDNQIGGKIEKYPNDIESGKKKGRPRQRDHVNLAKSLTQFGNSIRSQVYIALYLASGDSVEAKLNGQKRDQALRDLTFSFLFDLGRLAATDDGGAATLFKDTDAIGQLMVIYRDKIVKDHEDSHKWLKNASANIKTGKWPLRGFLLAQLGTLAVSSNPLAKRARRSVAGGLIAGGAMLAAGVTAFPAIATGLAVMGGLHFLQKRFGAK